MQNGGSFGISFELIENENETNGFKWKHSFSYFCRTKHTLYVKCTFEIGKIDYFQKSCGIL